MQPIAAVWIRLRHFLIQFHPQPRLGRRDNIPILPLHRFFEDVGMKPAPGLNAFQKSKNSAYRSPVEYWRRLPPARSTGAGRFARNRFPPCWRFFSPLKSRRPGRVPVAGWKRPIAPAPARIHIRRPCARRRRISRCPPPRPSPLTNFPSGHRFRGAGRQPPYRSRAHSGQNHCAADCWPICHHQQPEYHIWGSYTGY